MLASTLVTIAVCGVLRTALPAGAPDPGAGSALPSPGAASIQSPARAPAFGTIEIGALAGYGRGKVYDEARTPTSIGMVVARFALHLGPTGGGRMRGNFSFAAEGVGAWVDQTPAARGAGLNVLLRYTWAGERWRPMFVGGAGVLYADEEVPPGETKRNFTPQTGFGLWYMARNDVAIGGEYRFHHLSNKGATEDNPGINTHLLLFGVSWYR